MFTAAPEKPKFFKETFKGFFTFLHFIFCKVAFSLLGVTHLLEIQQRHYLQIPLILSN